MAMSLLCSCVSVIGGLHSRLPLSLFRLATYDSTPNKLQQNVCQVDNLCKIVVDNILKIGMSLVVKMRHLISKKLIRDLRRRSSIHRPSPRGRVATAAETGTASRL